LKRYFLQQGFSFLPTGACILQNTGSPLSLADSVKIRKGKENTEKKSSNH
jgi:hypothetical protein